MIKINGKSYNGKSITIVNGNISIDGSSLEMDEKNIKIEVKGDIEKLVVDKCDTVEINGKVGNVSTMSGDVKIKGNVQGNIKTMSGDVDCGTVGGNISTMSGDIDYKK